MDTLVLEVDETGRRQRPANQHHLRKFIVLDDRVVVADVQTVDMLAGLYLDTVCELGQRPRRKEFMAEQVRSAGACTSDGTVLLLWSVDRGMLREMVEDLPAGLEEALQEALTTAE